MLHGLSKKLSCAELKKIGLKNLPSHINRDNPFIAAVREYRLADLKGVMSCNVFTSFQTITLTYDVIVSHLKKVVDLAKSCEECLTSNIPCLYTSLDEPCDHCRKNNTHCISLVVFHVTWDMGSSQKKAARSVNKINEFSSIKDLKDSKMFTMGTGGLHLGKGATNGARNFVLNLNGERFGVNILRALRNGVDEVSEILCDVKSAVFQGKDRQSDSLSYSTTGEIVQKALSKKDYYNVIRSPEQILTYVENAKKQKSIIHPVAMQCNINGDVFVLDSGSACVLVFDNSTVARMYIIGKYQAPNSESYKCTENVKPKSTAQKVKHVKEVEQNLESQKGAEKVKPKSTRQKVKYAREAKLGSHLSSMVMANDTLYVADVSRKEVLVVRDCSLAKSVDSCVIHVIDTEPCYGLSFSGDCLISLLNKSDSADKIIEVACVEFPKKTAKDYLFRLSKKVLQIVQPSCCLSNIFIVSILAEEMFGALSKDGKIMFYHKKKNKYIERATALESVILPSSFSGAFITQPKNSKQLRISSVNSFGGPSDEKDISCKTHPLIVVSWHKAIFMIGKSGRNYVLEEIGNLDFARNFCAAINKFYRAISYSPPEEKIKPPLKSIKDCVVDGSIAVDLLMSMQEEQEKNYPSRKSFMGPNGVIFTDTVKCFQETVDSWRANINRLDHFNPTLADEVYSHTITNESLIEHSFGFVVSKGQAQLQNMYEYIHSKNKHELDFQMRMTDVPFNQYTKTKLRDKGYQELNSTFKTKLKMSEFWKIFCDQPSVEPSEFTAVEPTKEEKDLLQQAYLMSKSVPRRSNRSKWKSQSGFAPCLMEDRVSDGKLLAGDLVLCKVVSEIVYLKIDSDTELLNKNTMLAVDDLGSNKGITHVKVDDLLIDKGFIFTVPHDLYKLQDGCILFEDVLAESVAEVLQNAMHEHCGYTEEELSVVPEFSAVAGDQSSSSSHVKPLGSLDVDFDVSSSKMKRKCGSSEDDEVHLPNKVAKLNVTEQASIIPQDNVFYIVAFAGKKDVIHFIGQSIKKRNSDGMYWFKFMRKATTGVLIGESMEGVNTDDVFVWPQQEDNGLVSLDQIIKTLSNPKEVKSSSFRQGKLIFNHHEIVDYLKTLQ